jgi:gluconokinase
MTPKLSPRTRQLVERFFEPEEQAEAARRLVEDCGNSLPFCSQYDEYKMERIRFAVLRMGLGDMDEMQKAIDYAKRDWRDVLVWSGFGYDTTSHDQWAESVLQGEQKSMIGVVMGVSGSGKTTVGSQLAVTLNWMYYDADNFHTRENREKMSNGIPLTDEDRAEWLKKLRGLISRFIEKKQKMILACSALKESYRQILKANDDVRFVYLRGTYEQIEERMRQRKWHYMKPEMLKSQFEVLEEPKDVLTMDISKTPKEIVELIRKEWNL